ncbi:Vacuolar ATP synthase subunit E [Entamoeba marina]
MADISRQLQQMIKFIEFEAQSKEQEIRSNAEQECEREKAVFIDKERKKLEADYARKVKQAEVKRRITYSQELSSSRLNLLKEEDKFIQQLLGEVKAKLVEETKKGSYEQLLVKLIVEGVKKVDDNDVTIRCLEADLNYVKKAVETAKKELSGVKITLDEVFYLEDKAIGGVAISSLGDHIVCNNTLERRANAALTASLPKIRSIVFPSLKTQSQKS